MAARPEVAALLTDFDVERTGSGLRFVHRTGQLSTAKETELIGNATDEDMRAAASELAATPERLAGRSHALHPQGRRGDGRRRAPGEGTVIRVTAACSGTTSRSPPRGQDRSARSPGVPAMPPSLHLLPAPSLTSGGHLRAGAPHPVGSRPMRARAGHPQARFRWSCATNAEGGSM